MKLVPGDLISGAKYGSNLTDFEFTLNACAFMLALFPAYMVDKDLAPRRVSCLSLKGLGKPPIAHYLRAVRDKKWIRETRGCPRMCPKSWTIHCEPLGAWVIAAARDGQGYEATAHHKAGNWFGHILKNKARDVIRASLELAADMPPAECIGNREWRERQEEGEGDGD